MERNRNLGSAVLYSMLNPFLGVPLPVRKHPSNKLRVVYPMDGLAGQV